MVPQLSASLSGPDSQCVAFHTNHLEMVKFSDDGDHNFLILVHLLHQLIIRVQEKSQSITKSGQHESESHTGQPNFVEHRDAHYLKMLGCAYSCQDKIGCPAT